MILPRLSLGTRDTFVGGSFFFIIFNRDKYHKLIFKEIAGCIFKLKPRC